MNNKTKDLVITIIFILFLSSTLLLNIIKKDDDISISERRKLTQMPKFNITNILNGTYANQFDKYTTDQFIKRDSFRTLKAYMDLKIKNNYHNLYIKDDYVIELEYPLNINSVNNIINKINYIKDTYLLDNKIYYSIIPDKNYFVNDNNLKIDYAYLKNYMHDNLDITYIDIFDNIKLTDYYKNDHHLKIENVSTVAEKLLTSMDNTFYNNYTLSKIDNFNGVYSYRIPIKNKDEDLNIIRNKYIDNSFVYNYQTNTYTTVYDMTKINMGDKYSIYLSGSVPLIKVINNNSNSNRNLIIFRDSYASNITPYLISSYKTITLIDTRYIDSRLLKNYIDFSSSDILFLYSISLINNSFVLK